MILKLTTYRKSKDIPLLEGNSIFHSKALFLIYESTPGYLPYLVVARNENDEIVSYLLACSRSIKLLFPPCFFRRCEVFGEGEYRDDILDKEYLFGEMLKYLTKEVSKTSFIIEFRNLNNALWGYKYFRENHYFPINWLRVRNSLHSQQRAEERFSTSRLRQIKKGLKNGAIVEEATTSEDIKAFSQMLRKVYSIHIRKHFPNIDFFQHLEQQLIQGNKAKIFIVRYKGKVIGGSACIYSNNQVYLWFSGGMRKSYAIQYPGILAVWGALKDAFDRGYRHMEFMDVGLPFKKHGYRDFVLRFGGRQSSTRRWFRFRWQWLNKLFARIYV